MYRQHLSRFLALHVAELSWCEPCIDADSFLRHLLAAACKSQLQVSFQAVAGQIAIQVCVYVNVCAHSCDYICFCAYLHTCSYLHAYGRAHARLREGACPQHGMLMTTVCFGDLSDPYRMGILSMLKTSACRPHVFLQVSAHDAAHVAAV